MTRSETIGSFTLCASCRLPETPIFTTRLWVQLVLPALHIWNEFAQNEPFSQIWASLIGPERASLALKARWTVPRFPVHLFPFPVLQMLPPSTPFVSVHLSVTGTGPAPGAMLIDAADCQLAV